jgi:hypothetical protein
MSSSSHSSTSDLTLATLTAQELADLVADTRNHAFLHGAFPPDSHSSTLLQYFAYASKNAYDMEQELERHHRERQEIFEILQGNRRFRQRIRPIVNFHRRTAANIPRPTRVRAHPYRRPSTPHSSNSPSSSSSSHVSRRSVVINPEDALVPPPSSISTTSSLVSFRTAEEPNPNAQPGSSQNPINVDDELVDTCDCEGESWLCDVCDTRIRTCTRCNQEGHFHEDCETKIRSFTNCHACEFNWRGTVKPENAECHHYDISPGWAKRQRTRRNFGNPDD